MQITLWFLSFTSETAEQWSFFKCMAILIYVLDTLQLHIYSYMANFGGIETVSAYLNTFTI